MLIENLATTNDALESLQFLTPQERVELDRLLIADSRAALGVRLNRYIPHDPTPKQVEALRLDDAREVYFGGAAGGGKSDWLLISALQFVDKPNYAALLLRRTYADLALPKALMDRARAWLMNTPARWDDREKTWRFPSGATLTFGYLENENDKYRYQSSEFQFVGFDEVTQFSESQYLYLFSRLRRLAGSDVPLRMRSASNPDGVGMDWVRARFVPDEYVNSKDPGKFNRVWRRGDCAFVPSLLEDNPHLDRYEYEQSLSLLGVELEARLRRGDWGITPAGSLIKAEWFGADKYFPDLPDGATWKVRAWDLALDDEQVLPQIRKGKLPDYHATCKATIHNGDLWLGAPMIWRADWTDAVERIMSTMMVETSITHGTGRALHEKAAVKTLMRQGFGLVQYDESRGKLARAGGWINHAKIGKVKLVGTPDQWLDFQYWWWRFGTTEGVYDDSVDAVSGAVQMLGLTFEPIPTTPRKVVVNFG